jgi:carboxymethylenebutenolidase
VASTTDLTFPSSTGRPMRAALAVPRATERRPSVIVIHEIFGLNDDMRRIVSRFASLGYVALAPDLYDTEGMRLLCIARTMLALRRREGAAFADLEAARSWLATRPEVDPARTGVVGFCMGGGFALLYAVRAPLGVAGVFYGDVPASAEDLRGVCPVFAGYGERDRLFAAQGRRLAAHLEQLGVPHEVRMYPDAGHSYMSPHTGVLATVAGWGPMKVGFNPAAEADSWQRMAAFFRTHLG